MFHREVWYSILFVALKLCVVGGNVSLEPLSGLSRLGVRTEFSSCSLTHLMIFMIIKGPTVFIKGPSSFKVFWYIFTCDFIALATLISWPPAHGHLSQAHRGNTSLRLKPHEPQIFGSRVKAIYYPLLGVAFIASLCVKPGSNTY